MTGRGNRAVCIAIAATICLLAIPQVSFAEQAGDGGASMNITGILDLINQFVTGIALPIAVGLCVLKTVYFAVVCGGMGVDPFHLLSANDSSQRGSHGSNGGLNDVTLDKAKVAVMNSLGGMAKGLAWVLSIFVVFKITIVLASQMFNFLLQV